MVFSRNPTQILLCLIEKIVRYTVKYLPQCLGGRAVGSTDGVLVPPKRPEKMDVDVLM